MFSNFSFFKNLDSNLKVRFLAGFLILFVFQVWSTYKGEGVAKTHDSFHYLKTAENLVLHYNFIQLDTQPYVAWALGFPFLLIPFKDSIFLNLICILGTYIFYFDLIEKLFQKLITKWWLILAFVFSTPLYLIHHFVWSEPPFLFFLMGSIWTFYYFSYSATHQKLIWFCLFGFLFSAMRNAGLYFMVVINSGIIAIYLLPSLFFLKNKNLSFHNKAGFGKARLRQNPYLKSVLYFSLFSSLPILLWWLHAEMKMRENFDDMYTIAERSILEECINYSNILSSWFFPPSISLEIRTSLLIILSVFMLFLGAKIMVRLFREQNENITKNTKFFLFIFWITLFYLIELLVTRVGMTIDTERFSAIIYPFLCILIGFVLEKIKVNDFLKYGIAFLGLVYPFLRTLKNIIFWN